MTETIHLMPPEAGPSANPVLFAVAAALAELFPLAAPPPRPAAEAFPTCAPPAPKAPAEASRT